MPQQGLPFFFPGCMRLCDVARQDMSPNKEHQTTADGRHCSEDSTGEQVKPVEACVEI
jgi:hypothetical protein